MLMHSNKGLIAILLINTCKINQGTTGPVNAHLTPGPGMYFNALKYDFKHILNDFIHVYSPRTGTDNPWGQTFDVNRNS